MKTFLTYIWTLIQAYAVLIAGTVAAIVLAGQLGFIEPIRAYTILSGSMEPAISVGSIILVQKRLWYEVGDVITFTPRGDTRFVTHRISDIVETETVFGDRIFSTKGDANASKDAQPVSQAFVTGKVLVTIPYLGFFVDLTQRPQGFLIFVIIPATIIVYEELKTVRKEVSQSIRTMFSRKRVSAPQPQHHSAAQTTSQVPILPAVVVIVAAVSLFISTTGAFFSDEEVSMGNVFAAAASFVSH